MQHPQPDETVVPAGHPWDMAWMTSRSRGGPGPRDVRVVVQFVGREPLAGPGGVVLWWRGVLLHTWRLPLGDVLDRGQRGWDSGVCSPSPLGDLRRGLLAVLVMEHLDTSR